MRKVLFLSETFVCEFCCKSKEWKRTGGEVELVAPTYCLGGVRSIFFLVFTVLLLFVFVNLLFVFVVYFFGLDRYRQEMCRQIEKVCKDRYRRNRLFLFVLLYIFVSL